MDQHDELSHKINRTEETYQYQGVEHSGKWKLLSHPHMLYTSY